MSDAAFHRLLPGAGRGFFLLSGGMNVVAGVVLFTKPWADKEELVSRLARKFGGDRSKVQPDLALLAGAEMQLRGKGVLLAGIGSLLICAGASGNRKLMIALAGTVAAGDLILLALARFYRSRDAGFPALEAERALLPAGLGYAALEAGVFAAFLASCTRGHK